MLVSNFFHITKSSQQTNRTTTTSYKKGKKKKDRTITNHMLSLVLLVLWSVFTELKRFKHSCRFPEMGTTNDRTRERTKNKGLKNHSANRQQTVRSRAQRKTRGKSKHRKKNHIFTDRSSKTDHAEKYPINQRE